MRLKKLSLLAGISAVFTLSFAPNAQAQNFARRSNPTRLEERGLRVGDTTWHYLAAGPRDGEPVVLVHGWPETSRAWHLVMPLLAARGYRVLAPDLPGLGASSAPSDYSTRTIARMLHGFVGKLGYSRIRLVGHDVGTWVSYAYAASYPGDVRQLALLDAALPGVSPPTPQTHDNNFKSWQFAFNSIQGLPETLVRGRERSYLTWFFRTKAARPDSIPPQEINFYVRAYSSPRRMHNGFEYYRAVFSRPADTTTDQNRRFAQTKLTMPVLALGGADNGGGDGLYKTMLLAATDVRGGAITGCGHYIPEERPVYLARQLFSLFATD